MAMTETQYLLDVLSEECNEIAVRASKAIRFGLEEIQPGQTLTNAQRLALELDDLYGAIEMLNEKHPGTYIPNRDNIDAKKVKVSKFMKYSELCGTVRLDCDGGEQ
ncbi:hypothetical protein J7S78_13945 [Klebsiella oxytoca]|uniref:Uncharacterized protein n=1 Tax=Klebsiella oxytoca TaxID=571 RepID=A0AAP2FL74_KLEOX|nr:hypothetical protein [Klebsiella oxytoca]MBQ0600896.1 hypothetical protein [Klebsiella oxytoca]